MLDISIWMWYMYNTLRINHHPILCWPLAFPKQLINFQWFIKFGEPVLLACLSPVGEVFWTHYWYLAAPSTLDMFIIPEINSFPLIISPVGEHQYGIAISTRTRWGFISQISWCQQEKLFSHTGTEGKVLQKSNLSLIFLNKCLIFPFFHHPKWL